MHINFACFDTIPIHNSRFIFHTIRKVNKNTLVEVKFIKKSHENTFVTKYFSIYCLFYN